jgi:threonine dehydrogenase-like Zn-dependent dehydrogenase
VVLNPWLSCGPRGIDPPCPSCEVGDYSLCWSFADGDIKPGIHTGVSADATGGYAELMPAHDSMLFPVPDNVPDEQAVFADPFAVSLHAITRHPPPAGGRVLVYGAGSLGLCAVAILGALYPDVEVAVVARFDAQADVATKFGAAKVLAHEPRLAIIEEIVAWGGGRLRQPLQGLPMAYPGAVDVVYDTIGKPETFEVGVRVLKARGTLVKAGVHAPGRWEWSPLYFKEISWVGSNAFGFEEVEGRRQHGIAHYLDLVADGRVDLRPMLTHTFPLDQWRDAFLTIANQGASGAIKVAIDQRQ